MTDDSTHRVTAVLREIESGDRSAVGRLVELLREPLRAMAARQLRSERKGHTLQPTALVNEAYLKLVAESEQKFRTRLEFLTAASRVIREILIDHAKGRHRLKRGAGRTPLDLEQVLEQAVEAGDLDLEHLLDLHARLEELARLDEVQARIVELRYFAGLTLDEIAESMGRSRRWVSEEQRVALAWLRSRLGRDL